MPKPGQKSVTLNADVYQRAKKWAERADKSVAGFVTDLINEKTDKPNPAEKAAEDKAQ